MESYHPTIWRTCRILTSVKRIACLKAVLEQPGGCVGEIAALARIPRDQASLCLRALQARGLILARRESRWVRYWPEPDPLVPAAAPILAGMRRALLVEKLPIKCLTRCLTSFTHPRRLIILRGLQKSAPVTFETLSQASFVSAPALYRHLKKLDTRGLVQEGGTGWKLCLDHEQLADTFLTLIAVSPE